MMESVDELLLYGLRNSLSKDNEHIFSLGHKTISDLNADDLIRCLGKAFRVILNDDTIPDHATKSVSLRHRVSLRLANLVKELGYPHDCGYNHILYPVEAEVRQLLTWVVQQLRKAEAERGTAEEEAPEELDSKEAFRQNLARTIEAWTKRTWLPQAFKTQRHTLPFNTWHVRVPEDFGPANKYDNEKLPSIVEQCGADLVSTMLERAALHSAKRHELEESTGKAPTRKEIVEALQAAQGEKDVEKREQQIHVDMFETKNAPLSEVLAFREEEVLPPAEAEEDEETLAAERASELLGLQKQLDLLKRELREVKDLVEVELKERLEEQQRLKERLEEELSQLKHKADVKKKVLELLPNGQENVVKLQAALEENRAHLTLLEEEWKSHRDPLMKQKEEQARVLRLQEKAVARMRNEAVAMQEDLVRMDQEALKQDKLKVKLNTELSVLPKDINRKVYTARIVDIIKQVRKQDKEISRVIDDIRVLQREINALSQKLKRTEAVTDDTVFRITEKKKSESSYVTAYRLLTEMRQLFDQLIDAATETGKAKNHARDIETRSQTLASRLSNSRLEKLLQDLEEIRNENKLLRSQRK